MSGSLAATARARPASPGHGQGSNQDAWRRRSWLAGMLAGMAGACSLDSDVDHTGDDAPREAPLASQPRIAWVLGSGGPRGFVHVGVLQALEELGLVPDLIVGASVGALLGTLRAAGRSAFDLKVLALDLQPLAMARLAVGAQERFSGAPLASFVRAQAPVTLLERMPIPVACVAQRRRDGRVVAFTAGDAGVAVQASAAVEGQFAPVRIRGELHVDPDWAMPLPVRVARRLGAERVLAVDASAHVERAPPGAERFRGSDQRKKALVDTDAALADLVIKPDFGYWVSLSQEFRERAILSGHREAMARADALRALHARPAPRA